MQTSDRHQTNIRELYRQSRRAALAGLVVTLSLAAAKLVGGWAGNSLALLSDSVHSFGDALASAAIWGALTWAEQPPDREHPYGHMRIEGVAALTVAVLLVVSGLGVAYEAIVSWHSLLSPPQWYTLPIALVSMLANEAIYRYSIAVARRTGSKAVQTSAWDQRLDVVGSLIVLLGLAVATWAGPSWYVVDKISAVLVALIICCAGGTLFWGSLQELIDRQADAPMLAAIRAEALAVPGVHGVEKLLARKTGLEYLVDIHVEVDPAITVDQGHAIGHSVKSRLVD
ncbi:MAG TPA: cation diffusion facilitator family transporter, partial [Pirellulales bacterium]